MSTYQVNVYYITNFLLLKNKRISNNETDSHIFPTKISVYFLYLKLNLTLTVDVNFEQLARST